jgi:hypothetical protein
MMTVEVWLGWWLERKSGRSVKLITMLYSGGVAGWEATPPASPVGRIDVAGAGC